MTLPTGRDPHPQTREFAGMPAFEMANKLAAGQVSSVELTRSLLDRCEAIDNAGPRLSSIICLNGRALDEANSLDKERREGQRRSPLHGIPILIKDNIDTAGSMGTTAGCYALQGWAPAYDAPLVRCLREAGAIIVGKTNLSEWANVRSRPSSSGWSAVGGQTLNPHALDRSPGGSSAGSGAGVAAGLAPLAIGTETDGSILCPSSANGIVGLKPTVGLVSATGIVPVSPTQDTAGPMARCVVDAAILFGVLAGGVRAGNAPAGGAVAPSDGLNEDQRDLSRLTIGTLETEDDGASPAVRRLIENAHDALRAAGAKLVEVTECQQPSGEDEWIVLQTEFKASLNAYLKQRIEDRAAAGLKAAPLVRDLDEVIAFMLADGREKTASFTVNLMEAAAAAAGLDDSGYITARNNNKARAGSEGIDKACDSQGLDVLVDLAMGPAWPIDHVLGDQGRQTGWGRAAVAGYPSITLPVGKVNGLPFGLVIFGRAHSEATLLHVAYALEAQLSLDMSPEWAPASRLLVS